MVERIATAVREDGVNVNAVLALTFTEKAAGELAERLRRRLTELGDDESARAVDGGWIGTIHGFCARLLRAQPLAAGLDPHFEVLEETSAERLAEASYEAALETWARRHGAGAIDLAASYGPGLRDLVQDAYREPARPRPRPPAPGRSRRPRPGARTRRASRRRARRALRDLARAGRRRRA